MQKLLYKYILILFFSFIIIAANAFNKVNNFLAGDTYTFFFDTSKLTQADILFDTLHLGKLGLGRRAYEYAMLGYNVLKAKKKLSNDNILSIIDFSLPSSRKRLFVLDVKNYKLLFVTYVAHGKNSGLDKALYFSNEPESNKSSVGFYTTLSTYSGTHGYSMRLVGQEIGFNNKALERDIVVHSASYVDESVVKSQGYLGRSLGCPALSPEIYKQVINKIKNGTCLFVYGNDNKYIINSRFLKRPVKLERSPIK
ncbi:MAG TPA: murein L,D-transpeptidase catalytic domain family protein [Chitinophagaceae bacterium]|nr:murein L,D-transpeptidase catalytic domain family protein [Chitinophagaceae bacterium]